jgi:VanZ family protein
VRGPARSSYWLFGIAVVVQLLALYVPRAPSEGGGHGVDKVVHAAIFAAVVWTGRRAGLPLLWLVVVSAIHGPLSELIQSHLLPHRDGSVNDALADLVGVAIGAVLPTRRGPGPRERMRS